VLTNTTVPESTNFTYKKSNFIFEATISSFIAFLLLLFFLNLRKRAQNKNYRRARLQVLQEYSYRNIRNISSKIATSLKSFEFVPARIEKYVKNKLELVHSEMTYESVIRILAGSTVFLSIIFTLLFQNLILGIIFGAGIVWLGFNAIISNITTKQKLKFSMELPELLNILASALRAGLTLQQGLEAYASDSKSEVAREIRRAIGEIRVGTPIDEALMGVAKRMNSEDLEWAVTALSIQRVVGGSMATILTTTYETVKARSEIRREVRTLAAEGKLSAYVLMALPIGIFLFLLLTRREYVSAFWTNPMGYVLMAFVGVSMTFGWIWMKKIVEIKI
jgi:Flp pilus assembly protein TadB